VTGRRPGRLDTNKSRKMIRRSIRTASARVSVALAVIFVFTVGMPGCSTRNDSLPPLGTEEDYLARRESTAYPCGYDPYGLCAAYDSYCFAPYGYSAPIYGPPPTRLVRVAPHFVAGGFRGHGRR
jgi:hypothetical protein